MTESRRQWRVILPTDGPGAWQMAADVAILEAMRAGVAAPTLRFYRWTPPCVTLGKFQPAEGNVRLEDCARLGIDVAKRPTGGRAILHDQEVTFSILVAETDLPQAGASIMEGYRALGGALAVGLQRLGLPAELVDHHAPARSGDPGSMAAVGNPACFAARARCDLMVDGRKIIGCAQLRKDGIILQQNSLPLTIDFPRWEHVFYRSDWETVARESVATLWQAAGREVPYGEVVTALCAGITAMLHVDLVPGTLTAEEERRAEELAPAYAVKSA